MRYHYVPLNPVDRVVGALVYAQRRGPIGVLARLVLTLVGIDIPWTTQIGPGLRLPHSTIGRVIHGTTVIGRNVTIFHGVTVGRADVWNDPLTSSGVVLGDDVIIGAGAVLLFTEDRPLHVGDGAVIGANAVVTRDVPPGVVVAGNPAQVVRKLPV